MPSVGPTTRRDLIAGLRVSRFQGPFSGKSHQYMRRRMSVIRLPNPHRGDIGRSLLIRVLRQAGVSRKQRESVCCVRFW